MQCAKPHIGLHKQALKRAHALHNITQGSINRLWTELVGVFNVSHAFWKAPPIFKIKCLWQTFCVFHSYMRWVFIFVARALDQRSHPFKDPTSSKYHGDNWTSTEQSFEIYKSVKQKKFEPLLEILILLGQSKGRYWFCLSAKCPTFINIS